MLKGGDVKPIPGPQMSYNYCDNTWLPPGACTLKCPKGDSDCKGVGNGKCYAKTTNCTGYWPPKAM